MNMNTTAETSVFSRSGYIRTGTKPKFICLHWLYFPHKWPTFQACNIRSRAPAAHTKVGVLRITTDWQQMSVGVSVATGKWRRATELEWTDPWTRRKKQHTVEADGRTSVGSNSPDDAQRRSHARAATLCIYKNPETN